MYTYTVSLSYRSSHRQSEWLKSLSFKISLFYIFRRSCCLFFPNMTTTICIRCRLLRVRVTRVPFRVVRVPLFPQYEFWHTFMRCNFTLLCLLQTNGELVGHKTGKVLVGSSSHSQCICRRRPCRPQLRLQHWMASPIWAPPRTRFIHTNSISAFYKMCLCWFVVVVPVASRCMM